MKDEESGEDPSSQLFAFWAAQNHQFSIGFIRFGDMADYHVIYSEKTNAFLMLFGVIFDFWLKSINKTLV